MNLFSNGPTFPPSRLPDQETYLLVKSLSISWRQDIESVCGHFGCVKTLMIKERKQQLGQNRWHEIFTFVYDLDVQWLIVHLLWRDLNKTNAQQCSERKWWMKYIYVSLLLKVFYNVAFHSPIHTHSNSYTDGWACFARGQPAHQEKLGVQCRARRHLKTVWRGAGYWTSNPTIRQSLYLPRQHERCCHNGANVVLLLCCFLSWHAPLKDNGNGKGKLLWPCIFTQTLSDLIFKLILCLQVYFF